MALLRDKMKLRLSILAVLAFLLMGARNPDTMVMTLINKSGMQIAVSIVAQDLTRVYYFTIPEGDKSSPTTSQVEIFKTTYRMRVFWLGEKDPVTGNECRQSRSSTLIARRNMRVVVGRCDMAPEHRGEPTMYKFGRWRCME